MGAPVPLLLDFDGVINVERPHWNDKDMHAKVRAADGEVYPIRWSAALVEALDGMHRQGLVEIVWCSTWCGDAATLNALLGVDYRPLWTELLDWRQSAARKVAEARRLMAAGTRFVWCDDEAIPRARERRSMGMTGDALYIVPGSRTGLGPKHLAQIAAYAAAPALCG